MTIPVRLQLSRRKGFNLQEHSRAVNGLPAVNCARPGMWGNYAAVRDGQLTGPSAVASFLRWIDEEASWAWKDRATIDLQGKNLACWCDLGEPCHADVLLEFALSVRKDKIAP
jgi:hypothetical protein